MKKIHHLQDIAGLLTSGDVLVRKVGGDNREAWVSKSARMSRSAGYLRLQTELGEPGQIGLLNA